MASAVTVVLDGPDDKGSKVEGVPSRFLTGAQAKGWSAVKDAVEQSRGRTVCTLLPGDVINAHSVMCAVGEGRAADVDQQEDAFVHRHRDRRGGGCAEALKVGP